MNPQAYGELVSQRRSGASAFYHYDALGSTRALTNAAQTATDTADYKAFGLANASSGSTTNPFRWVGRLGYYWQPDTSDHWLRARVYRPTTGRFVMRDPVRQLNLYAFPNNAPVMVVDPSGRKGACQKPQTTTPSAPTPAASGTCPGWVGDPPLPPKGFQPSPRWPCGSSLASATCTNPNNAAERCGICWPTAGVAFLGCDCVNWDKAQHVGNACCRAAVHPLDAKKDTTVAWRFGRCLKAKSKCGPEIRRPLMVTMGNIQKAYADAPLLQKAVLCAWALSVASVDITNIHGSAPSAAGCGIGGCVDTVQVGGQCHSTIAVNYVGVGLALRLCAWLHQKTLAYWRDIAYAYCLALHRDFGLCRCAQKWFEAGWNEWPGVETPPDCEPGCGYCREEVTDRAFQVVWGYGPGGIVIDPQGGVTPYPP